MILRKPYGFLIKHYKIINFILLIPMFYIALKFGDIASFFRDYISAKLGKISQQSKVDYSLTEIKDNRLSNNCK